VYNNNKFHSYDLSTIIVPAIPILMQISSVSDVCMTGKLYCNVKHAIDVCIMTGDTQAAVDGV